MLSPSYLSRGEGSKACALCSICAICLADGPIPDFEGTGVAGLFALWPW